MCFQPEIFMPAYIVLEASLRAIHLISFCLLQVDFPATGYAAH